MPAYSSGCADDAPCDLTDYSSRRVIPPYVCSDDEFALNKSPNIVEEDYAAKKAAKNLRFRWWAP